MNQPDGRHGPQGRFVVAGEALVDVVVPASGSPRRSPGGSPLNVAVGLARLGVPTMLLTEIGDDALGELVHAHLTAAGVELAVDAVVPGRRTGTATARLDESGVADYDLDLVWTLQPFGLPEETVGLHVGSLGAALQPGRAAVLRLAQQARAAGLVVSFDPNVRPAATPDPAPAWADMLELAAVADVVKLSDEDLRFLQPQLSPDELAARLLRHGSRLVVVTEGDRGATAYSAVGRCHVPSPSVSVVDTVGAGDSFMAALLAAVLAQGPGPGLGQDLDDDRLGRYLTAAHEAAATTVTRPGADPPRREDLSAGWPHL